MTRAMHDLAGHGRPRRCFQGHFLDEDPALCPFCPTLEAWIGQEDAPRPPLPVAIRPPAGAPAPEHPPAADSTPGAAGEPPPAPVETTPETKPAEAPRRSSAARSLGLRVIEGGDRGRVFDLPKRAFIGRSPRIRVSLEDPALKTIHAVLTVTRQGIEVVDASGDGVVINGRHTIRGLMAVGDVLTVGRTQLQIVELSADDRPSTGPEA